MQQNNQKPAQAVGLMRYVGVLLYEALILMALLLFVGFLTIPILLAALGVESSHKQVVVLPEWGQWIVLLIMLSTCFAYFAWCWVRCQGQTLPMRTWRVCLVSTDGVPITLHQAAVRYIVATLGLAFFGAALVWRWFDRDGLMLQDRLSGTRLVRV